MTDAVDKCIFCGNTDTSIITGEHLWGRWSRHHIKRSMRRWSRQRAIGRIELGEVTVEGEKTSHKGGDIHDMKVWCVCGGKKNTCNNGWMRTFENIARPILIPLMNAQDLRLSPHQQSVVAGWAALKAMVAEYNPIGFVTSTQGDRDRMMALQLPPQEGWGIWIGNFERHAWPGHLASNPFAYWPEPERAHLLGVPTTDFNGQSSFQVTKKLFIQVIRCRVPELVEKWRFDHRATNLLRKIWPPSGYSIVWPPPAMSDWDADYVASAFPRAATTAVQRRLARGTHVQAP